MSMSHSRTVPSSHASSSSVSGGWGVPLGELSHWMCLNLLLTSLSLICALVSFFFFFALNFMSELSSAPEFAADAAALLTLLLTLLEPGRESSNRSSDTARWPLCVTRPSATCHCSGQRAPTNSSLCEILDFRLVGVCFWESWGCSHHYTAFVVSDRHRQPAQRITIQEVGRFVEHKQMRVIPHRARQDHLDFLTST
jgi:hypothetical protein